MSAAATAPIEDLLERAKNSYVRSFERSQELFTKIYQRELDPMALQSRFTPFLQEQSPEFSRQLTALGFELLKGLADLQARYADDYMSGLLGEDSSSRAAPPPPPTSATLNDWAQWQQSILAYLSEQARQAQQRYTALLQKVAAGEIAPSTIQEYSAKFANGAGLLMSRDSAALGTRFLERLGELNQQFADKLFDHLLNGHASRADAAIDSVYLELSGPPGSTVTASLEVENTTSKTSNVSCQISDFRPTDGAGAAFRAPLQVQPRDFRLEPGEARSVSLRLTLAPDLFEPGRNYTGTMLINKNGEGVVVVLGVRSVAPPPPKKEAPSVLHLVGPLGGVATASLTLTNTNEKPAHIRCSATDVRRADGVGPAFAPKILSTREVFDLGPGEEATIQVSLKLEPTDYETEVPYVGALLINGLDVSRFEVPLRIVANPAPPEPKRKVRVRGK
jgi:hypothetical protein